MQHGAEPSVDNVAHVTRDVDAQVLLPDSLRSAGRRRRRARFSEVRLTRHFTEQRPGVPRQRGPRPLLDQNLEGVARGVQIVDVTRAKRDEPPTIWLQRAVCRLVGYLLGKHERLRGTFLFAKRESEAVFDGGNLRAVRM